MSLNYRGGSNYGTILGGVFSCVATIFFALFIAVQLYSWLFEPNFSQTFSKAYLHRDSNETYTIDTRIFLPTLTIVSVDDNRNEQFNNADFFEVEWKQVTDYDNEQILDEINCLELIDSWKDVSDAEKAALYQELGETGSRCPKVDSF